MFHICFSTQSGINYPVFGDGDDSDTHNNMMLCKSRVEFVWSIMRMLLYYIYGYILYADIILYTKIK